MPRGDRTGPFGMGPRTGRGLGYCGGFDSPGFTKGPGWGRGRGLGRSLRFWGRCLGWEWRWLFGPKASPEDEKETLKEEAEFLKRRLVEIEKRLSELEIK